MASEEQLPDELDKLEIAPTLAQVKLMDKHLPISLNPFYDKKMVNGDDVEYQTPKCRKCRQRRRSESVLDDYKASLDIRSSPGVQRQSFKKMPLSASASKKIILRQPVLSALQTCLHPQSTQRKLMLSAENDKATTSSTAGARSDTATTSVANRGINDFRDLISECQTLLEQDVDFSGRLNRLSISNRNSKNFTIMQTPHKSKRFIECSITGTDNVSSGSNANGKLFPSYSIKRNSTSPSPEHSTASHTNTSCRRAMQHQADNGANNSNCDDVTIDELASYFDTFVHIPKKMSSMAEMMYI